VVVEKSGALIVPVSQDDVKASAKMDSSTLPPRKSWRILRSPYRKPTQVGE
jgi:hypothetical protein